MVAADKGTSGSNNMITGSEQVGTFRYLVADERWWFSPEVFAMHGLAPDTVLTSDLVLAFKHPDDRLPSLELITKVLFVGKPFCFPHRIIDTAGQTHNVVVLGHATTDAAGLTTSIDGYAVDLTDSQRRYADEAGTEAIRAATEHRAAIEQAKGAMMVVYGLSPVAAIELLRWHSTQSNVKLQVVAERLVELLTGKTLSSPVTRRSVDQMLYDITHRLD
ncbi:ANTAR domain-containing protein [Kribbella sp. NPDC056861]|uniref:ANTAR domain-containing protein n=1 Tax=Kribbella sp. NPDC056861 TaxID=3154857 RepID=UPI00343ACD27